MLKEQLVGIGTELGPFVKRVSFIIFCNQSRQSSLNYFPTIILDNPATTVLPTTEEPPTTTIVVTTTDAPTEPATTKPPTTKAPATTIIATTNEVIENTGLIGLSKVSEALDGIIMEWNENLQDPGTGAAVQSQYLRVISSLYSQPKVINLSTDASTYQLSNVQPGIVYQIELVVTFENGAMYRYIPEYFQIFS